MNRREIIVVSNRTQVRAAIISTIDSSRYIVNEHDLLPQTIRPLEPVQQCLLAALDNPHDISPLMALSHCYPVIVVLDDSATSEQEVELLMKGIHETIRLGELTHASTSVLIEKAFVRFKGAQFEEQHEQMFNALCDSLTFQMAYRIVVRPGEEARFVYVSEGVRHISGLSREEVINNHNALYDQIVPIDRQRLDQAEKKAVNTLTPFELEVQKIDSSGRLRWVHIRSFPSVSTDGTITWDGVETDITGYKMTEEEIKRLLAINQTLLERERLAREKSEQDGRMKDEFLATLSHELRTPINAVLGWIQLIQRGGLSEADFDRAIKTIDRNARVQSQMIADLLDMSRIISGKVQLEFEPIDVRQLILGVIDTLKPSAESKRIELVVSIDPRLKLTLSGERARLQQIFVNLITNAIKFTPEAGKVSVEVFEDRDKINFEITDTGIGIKPEFLPFIFERFRQADATFARKVGGLGLGLAIVKQLTELHFGAVTAASEGEGKGTTFTVVLPGKEHHPSFGHDVKTYPKIISFNPSALTDVKILLIDDENDALEWVKRILAQAGAQVITANSGQEALDLLEKKDTILDVIISDIGMPEMDGMQLISKIRSSFAEVAHTPAIALTAFARSEDRSRMLEAGYDLHISKPVEAGELIVSIQRLLPSLTPIARAG